MTFALGIILFVIGIAVSVALHEAGHLLTAKWLGARKCAPISSALVPLFPPQGGN